MGREKLIRDKIPEIMRMTGEEPNVRTASSIEYARLLDKKLIEEVNEFFRDRNVEELADILEVVRELAKSIGVTMTVVESVRLAKCIRKGGFSKRIVLTAK